MSIESNRNVRSTFQLVLFSTNTPTLTPQKRRRILSASACHGNFVWNGGRRQSKISIENWLCGQCCIEATKVRNFIQGLAVMSLSSEPEIKSPGASGRLHIWTRSVSSSPTICVLVCRRRIPSSQSSSSSSCVYSTERGVIRAENTTTHRNPDGSWTVTRSVTTNNRPDGDGVTMIVEGGGHGKSWRYGDVTVIVWDKKADAPEWSLIYIDKFESVS